MTDRAMDDRPKISRSQIDRHTSIDEIPLAFLDVETTGLSPELGDRVCEIAVLRCQGEDAVDSYQRLVNPQRTMGEGAYRVHGISDEMLIDAPPFADVADDVLAVLDGAVLVGHNAPFDIGFLLQEYALIPRPFPLPIALDTLKLARNTVRASSYALGRLVASLGIEVAGSAHRAMADVIATRGLFDVLVDHLWRQGIRTLSQLITHQGGPIRVRRAPQLDVPAPIREALANRDLLWIQYRSEAGDITERFVRPIRVFSRDGHTVLLAHCMLRDSRRTFRVDRIAKVDVVTQTEE